MRGSCRDRAEPVGHAECCRRGYYVCMTSITVRNVPEDTRDELAARAARSGRSLQEYLRRLMIDTAGKPDVNTLMDRVVERKAATGSTLSTSTIVEHLDADRT